MPSSKIENNIRAERARKKLSQEKVAEMLHISKNAYNLKENGVRKFTLDEFRTLLKILECEPQDLL